MSSVKFTTLRKGLLEFLILGIVSSGRVYVADILQRLSNTDFATQEGTLYPLLSKLRRDGVVDYVWKESDAGPPRKYYQLTKAGHAALASQKTEWTGFTTAVARVLEGRPPASTTRTAGANR